MKTGVAETHAVRRGGEELLQLSVQCAVLVPGDDGVHVLRVRQRTQGNVKHATPGELLAVQNDGEGVPAVDESSRA